MGNSRENLQAAFAGESQASRKYLYFADKAEKEGHPNIAKLFRAASDAETVHARNHLGAMSGIGSTQDNVKAAIEGEHYEFTKMYPEFIEKAKAEKNNAALLTFDWANQVEQVHHQLYQKALQALQSGKPLEKKNIYVCQNCGNTVEGEAPDKCPVCSKPKDWFKKIE
jgi:rubrerythrin